MSTVMLEIPAEFATRLGATDEEARSNARTEPANEMCRESRWSTGKAARFAGMSRIGFMGLLRERQVPLPHTRQMLEEDFEHARRRVA